MKRIFFVASCPTINIGYSRIAHQLANHLALSFKVYYFAYSQGGEIPRFVHPNITMFDVVNAEVREHLAAGKSPDTYEQRYGTTYFLEHLRQFDPDILLIYNDLIVLYNRLFQLDISSVRFKVVTYADVVYEYPRQDIMNLICDRSDVVYTFSECWTKHLTQDLGFPVPKVRTLPHGINACFHRVDTKEARRQLQLPENAFIVLNTNRNSYRKRTDITVYAFFAFWQMIGSPSNVYLALNCDLYTTREYDVRWLLEVTSRRLKLDRSAMENRILNISAAGPFTDTQMNLLYNACDVGLNTTNAEGFGLCNLEHAFVGKPQVISSVGSLRDIFGSDYKLMVPQVASYELTCLHGCDYGLVRVFNELEYANRLKDVYENYEQRQQELMLMLPALKTRYNWTTLMAGFTNDLMTLIRPNDTVLRVVLNTTAANLTSHHRWFAHCHMSTDLALVSFVGQHPDHWPMCVTYEREFVLPRSVPEILDTLKSYPAFQLSDGDVRFGLVTTAQWFKAQGYTLWMNRSHLPFVPSSGFRQ